MDMQIPLELRGITHPDHPERMGPCLRTVYQKTTRVYKKAAAGFFKKLQNSEYQIEKK